MVISQAQVQKIAVLARLKLTDVETESMSRRLSAILDYMDALTGVDTANVEPLAHPLPIHNVFRDDSPGRSLAANEALANAPKRSGDFYAVPAILD
jgi:aspartyl-tRNA(Asn)/glutamyl-tRNA(Gln) amidotransferase subunit C